MNDELVKTGIPGLDEILKGGLRKGTSVIINGSPGTGKTIFAIQFIIEGAKQGEPGMYITFEEDINSVKSYAKALGLEIEKYEKKGLLSFVQQKIEAKKILTIAAPINLIKKKGIKRVALDSLSLFEYINAAGSIEYRKEVLNFVLRMRESGVTTLVTSQKNTNDINNIDYKPEDYLFEGIFMITKVRKGSIFERVFSVTKLRGQDHLIDLYPFQIGHGGISVFPKQIPFALIEKEEMDFKK